MSAIEITEYSDPVCPFAWSAEPHRRRIEWLYGDQLSFTRRMVGLHESVEKMEDAGFTTAKFQAGQRKLSEAHRMPIDISERPRLAASIPSCHAVVAVRLHQPDSERAILRALRVLNFAGWMSDEIATLHEAARRVGVDPGALDRWMADPASQAALDADMEAARTPTAEAIALSDRLAGSDEGGWRYTCPSWELVRDGATLSVPGFQPLDSYLVALANLGPDLIKREDPDDVSEVLRWAGEPLASAEVAAVCDVDIEQARQQLGGVADEEHIGFEGLWSLSGGSR